MSSEDSYTKEQRIKILEEKNRDLEKEKEKNWASNKNLLFFIIFVGILFLGCTIYFGYVFLNKGRNDILPIFVMTLSFSIVIGTYPAFKKYYDQVEYSYGEKAKIIGPLAFILILSITLISTILPLNKEMEEKKNIKIIPPIEEWFAVDSSNGSMIDVSIGNKIKNEAPKTDIRNDLILATNNTGKLIISSDTTIIGKIEEDDLINHFFLPCAPDLIKLSLLGVSNVTYIPEDMENIALSKFSAKVPFDIIITEIADRSVVDESETTFYVCEKENRNKHLKKYQITTWGTKIFLYDNRTFLISVIQHDHRASSTEKFTKFAVTEIVYNNEK